MARGLRVVLLDLLVERAEFGHGGEVNVVSTEGGIISISLEGGCTGCSATPTTAMQIYYSLMKLEDVNDVIFLNGELPEYMRAFIDDKLKIEP